MNAIERSSGDQRGVKYSSAGRHGDCLDLRSIAVEDRQRGAASRFLKRRDPQAVMTDVGSGGRLRQLPRRRAAKRGNLPERAGFAFFSAGVKYTIALESGVHRG